MLAPPAAVGLTAMPMLAVAAVWMVIPPLVPLAVPAVARGCLVITLAALAAFPPPMPTPLGGSDTRPDTRLGTRLGLGLGLGLVVGVGVGVGVGVRVS